MALVTFTVTNGPTDDFPYVVDMPEGTTITFTPMLGGFISRTASRAGAAGRTCSVRHLEGVPRRKAQRHG